MVFSSKIEFQVKIFSKSTRAFAVATKSDRKFFYYKKTKKKKAIDKIFVQKNGLKKIEYGRQSLQSVKVNEFLIVLNIPKKGVKKLYLIGIIVYKRKLFC